MLVDPASRARTILKLLVPPAILALAKRVAGRPVSFSGDYASWEEASAHATGYDADEILRRVVVGTRKVVAGEAIYERDSVVFDHIEYSWPLLASLLQIAAERRSLRVIDFGGSLGSTWRQNRRFLERLELPLSWRVVEQPHFVSIGRKEFSDEILQFYQSINEASAGGADVVLFCGSLCYVSDPHMFLDEAAAVAPYLIIDRLPLIRGDQDRFALQKVGEPIYTASYPVRLFSERTLLTNLLARWRLIERWNCDLHLQPDPASTSQGFFMEMR